MIDLRSDTRRMCRPFSVGAMVSFVDASTAATAGTARVTAIEPKSVLKSNPLETLAARRVRGNRLGRQ
ncbi:MAG: hypothetical protein ACT4QD_24510 [Acidobacteriota bacterium]